MFETLFDSADALARHRDGPFAEDRRRFLDLRSREGFSHGKLREYARMLLWIAWSTEIGRPPTSRFDGRVATTQP